MRFSNPQDLQIDTPFVIKGDVTNDYPSVGLLKIYYPALEKTSVCTGTLIAPQWFLTAAHCVLSKANLDRTTTVFFERVDSLGAIRKIAVPATECFVHPEYDLRNIQRGERVDIALFKLAFPVQGITPAKLLFEIDRKKLGSDLLTYANIRDALRRGSLDTKTEATLVGYGESILKMSDFGVKRKARVQISDVRNRRFKVAVSPSGQVVCSGDSGGPAFVQKNGKDYLAGVVSTSDSKCRSFGKFTRIDMYAPLLAQIIGAVDTSTGVLRAVPNPSFQPTLINSSVAPNKQFSALGFGPIQQAGLARPSKTETLFENLVLGTAFSLVLLRLVLRED